MCKGTTCAHHVDPAVQYLERDYEHMQLVPAPSGSDYTIVIDAREVAKYQYSLWRPKTETGDLAPTVSHVQPMYTLKSDEGHTESADWDGFEGPGMPWEEDCPIGVADNSRSDSYSCYLETYYTERCIPVPESVAETAAIYRREAELRIAENNARWKREQEERATRQESFRRDSEQRLRDARNWPFDRWRAVWGDDEAHYERLRGMQGQRADHVIVDEAYSAQAEVYARGLSASMSRDFWLNATDGMRNTMEASTTMHEALEELQSNLRELGRAATQDTQDG